VRVVHVLRKPLSEGTVAANVLTHGTGALNINASRIAAPGETISNHSRGAESAISKGIYGDSKGQETHQTSGQKRGRWPPNLILEHDEGCQCIGTKRVKGSPTSKTFHESYEGDGVTPLLRGWSHPGNQHADADGKETIAVWDCAPGCAVAALDEQSLAGGMHGAGKARSKVVEGDVESTSINMGGARDMFRLGDKGGASRFYKQVGGSTRPSGE
jgi:hypothetical protein